MKAIKTISLIVLGVMFLAACAPRVRPHGNHGLPPGQVKKVTGSKSAKPHAPGQVNKSANKKHHGNRRGHHKR